MITVDDNPARNRLEAHEGDDLAGFADYLRTPELLAFVHTEVHGRFEGHGVGSQLARAGVELARSEGLKVLAICPFIATWLTRHPEHQDLEYRATSSVTD